MSSYQDGSLLSTLDPPFKKSRRRRDLSSSHCHQIGETKKLGTASQNHNYYLKYFYKLKILWFLNL